MIYAHIAPMLVVKDNQIDTFDLQQLVENMGFQSPHLTTNRELVKEIIQQHQPPVILCDLSMDSNLHCLDLLQQCSDQSSKFIVITSCLKGSFYDETKAVGVGGHMIKPFHTLSLRSVIDRILTIPATITASETPFLFMKNPTNKQVRIDFKDILYLYSERNYVFVKTFDKIYTTKRSLAKMQEALDERFVRVHNSYVINTNHIKYMAPLMVVVHKDSLPLGRAYRKNLTDKLISLREKH